MVSERYLPDLARVFSPPAFRELAATGRINRLTYILRESGWPRPELSRHTLADLLTRLYHQLLDAHRLEYVYKNAIVTKWLLGKHSLNTCTFLSEFDVAGAKADVLLLNSHAHVLEIKTSLDDMSRIARQLDSYRKLFGYVSILTAPETLSAVTHTVGDDIGIYILSPAYTLQEIRAPIANYEDFSTPEVVACLRKSEYSEVIRTLRGDIPDVPNALYYSHCRSLIKELSPQEVHAEMFRVLKARKPKEHVRNTVEKVPSPLRALWLMAKLKVEALDRVLTRLDQPYVLL